MVWIQFLLPKRFLSRLIFYLVSIKNNKIKNFLISLFIKVYKVDLSKARRENIKDYIDFNDFFTRELKPELRPIANSNIVSPVDGVISQFGNIDNDKIIQAKKHNYSLTNLLAKDSRSDKFSQGFFVTIYLSPKDYHRIHMPYDGVLKKMAYIAGDLFSVNQKTVQNVNNIFARNERVVCYFETEFGLSAVILVGAIFVGSIQTVWHGKVNADHPRKNQYFDYNQNLSFKKGQEIARFNMGSSVIMLLPERSNNFNLKSNQAVIFGQDI